ncbi:hypothetical protein SFR_1718 [Streptomyces sp. FR-008]|nr:hypothetical protein SFR_1718 [Streptomyces sp. FR-008]
MGGEERAEGGAEGSAEGASAGVRERHPLRPHTHAPTLRLRPSATRPHPRHPRRHPNVRGVRGV